MNSSIRLIIFDLDGVLCDCKMLHYEALNASLADIDLKYRISYEEHITKYDALDTKRKLIMLTQDKGLPTEYHESVWKAKQQKTIEIVKGLSIDHRISDVLRRLKESGFTIAVASNSVRDTIKFILLKSGFMEYVDFFLSNQDVRFPKPNTEIYLSCMIKAGVSPKETLIIEDSHVGRKAASDSGAFLFPVNNSHDVKYEEIMDKINHIDKTKSPQKWQDSKMNILIPMAGAGSRFEKAGFTFPKPLIEVNGEPMIQTVVGNINIDAHYIFIVQKKHYEKYNLEYLLRLIAPNCDIIQTEGITEGAACTTLLAKGLIDCDKPLLIANSDQFIEWDSSEFMYAASSEETDGSILTFRNIHPKWSYVRLNENGFVTEVAEKKLISDIATVGIYFWRRGSDYVKYAEQMIYKGIRTNNEFYVCPVYNEAIQDGKRIKAFNISKMWGLGTPEDLAVFLERSRTP